MDGQPPVDHPYPAVDMGYNYQPKKHQVLCIPHMHAMLDHEFTSLVYYDWLRLQPQQTITEGAIR